MPLANLPNDPRPSTPPPQNDVVDASDSQTRSPYLQQLEEAISTPVPDLASTLNPAPATDETLEHPSQPDSHAQLQALELPQQESFPQLSRHYARDGGSSDRSGDDHFTRRLYLTESEFQRWPSESRRRVTMQSQLSRVREESRAAESGTQNYSTTGNGPARQSLYDWAAIRRRSRSRSRNRSRNRSSVFRDESEEEGELTARTDIGSDADQLARRDLERALRNYRSARNALRTGRGSGYEVSQVPTASALRAFWSEESSHNESTSHARQPNEIPDDLEQTQNRTRRLERARLEAERERTRNLTLPSILNLSRERRMSEAFSKVRNLIKYLSELRTTDFRDSLDLARRLELDSLYECQDSNKPSDLPMTIEALPKPRYSSWLEPGMVWQGLQATEKEQPQSPILASNLRREMQREYLRRAMVRRGLGGENDNFTEPQNSANILLDADRYLSDLLQDGNGRWGFHSGERRQPTISNIPSSSADSSPYEGDHWPVKVTIHSVNFEDMTLTGTMAAKHIPDKFAPSSPDHNPEGNSTESFFQGEIVDFRRHTLESDGSNGYNVGGIDIDAQYWQRIGPFREAISQIVQSTSSIHSSSKVHLSQTIKSWRENVDSIEALNATDNKMAQCLSNATWLSEKMGEQWILMRWKEKCFVTTAESSNTNSSSSTSRVYTTSSTPEHTAWGLTISGFYYIALNRFTGDIDGLYYDPGSQPYQQLKMTPVDSSNSTTDGVRKAFPSVEFR